MDCWRLLLQSNNIWPEGKSGQNSLDEFWGREPFFGSGVLNVPQIVEGAGWEHRCWIRYQNERWNSIVILMCNVC